MKDEPEGAVKPQGNQTASGFAASEVQCISHNNSGSSFILHPSSFSYRVTLMGLGRHGGGVGAARWLAEHGAQLTITDLAAAAELADSLAAIADVPVSQLRLGEHVEEDFTSADLVVVNPAVRPGHPLVKLAGSRGARIASETELFLRACPAPVIGVTGSNGKSTTASMIAAMLEADGRRVWLGGNIGRSLLTELSQIRSDEVVVLELSSFQLHYLPPDVRGPQVAVITNCAPNHLDWHDSFEAYRAAKQKLLTLQQPGDLAVLNVQDAEVSTWSTLARGRVAMPIAGNLVPPLLVPGLHNRVNALLAATAAAAVGCSEATMHRALAEFRGLPHRLEFVAEIEGRRFYNDSKATTPEAAMAAISAFSEPVWVLAGGYAKGGNYSHLADFIGCHARGVAFFGSAAKMLETELRRTWREAESVVCETLAQSLAWAWSRSQPGDVILLSPACASFDQFHDYAERGEHFCGLVRQIDPSARGTAWNGRKVLPVSTV